MLKRRKIIISDLKNLKKKIILYAAHFAVLHAKYWEKFAVDLSALMGGSTVLQKYGSNFKTLCARRMDRSNRHSEDP